MQVWTGTTAASRRLERTGHPSALEPENARVSGMYSKRWCRRGFTGCALECRYHGLLSHIQSWSYVFMPDLPGETTKLSCMPVGDIQVILKLLHSIYAMSQQELQESPGRSGMYTWLWDACMPFQDMAHELLSEIQTWSHVCMPHLSGDICNSCRDVA